MASLHSFNWSQIFPFCCGYAWFFPMYLDRENHYSFTPWGFFILIQSSFLVLQSMHRNKQFFLPSLQMCCFCFAFLDFLFSFVFVINMIFITVYQLGATYLAGGCTMQCTCTVRGFPECVPFQCMTNAVCQTNPDQSQSCVCGSNFIQDGTDCVGKQIALAAEVQTALF